MHFELSIKKPTIWGFFGRGGEICKENYSNPAASVKLKETTWWVTSV